jgi:hypothetical protein
MGGFAQSGGIYLPGINHFLASFSKMPKTCRPIIYRLTRRHGFTENIPETISDAIS